MSSHRARGKTDAFVGIALAHGFRLTGHPVFIKMFHRRRKLLLWRIELAAIASRLRGNPGNLLVFGAGNDSIFWHALNRAGRTIFIEDDPHWRDLVRDEWRSLRIDLVHYATRLPALPLQAAEDAAPAPLDLPPDVRARKWDMIIVDAPQGWGDGPGRLQSIYEASRLVDTRGRIFVHDCDREGERGLVARYLRHLHCTPLTERLWMFETAARS